MQCDTQDVYITCTCLSRGVWHCTTSLDTCTYPSPCATHPHRTSSTLHSVEDAVVGFAGTVRENIKLRRAVALQGPIIGTYIHTSPAPGVGRMAAAVALGGTGVPEGGSAAPGLVGLAKSLAMHVVAARPVYLDRESVPAAALDGVWVGWGSVFVGGVGCLYCVENVG